MNDSVAATEETVTAPEAEAPTQRLAFDKDQEAEVPQFLKRTRTAKSREDQDPESEPSVENPVKNGGLDGKELHSLAELSIEQLKQQQAELEKQISEKQRSERAAVISQISQVMTDYNIALEDLVESLGGMKFKRKGTKAKPKYRDPATGTTWSGRGKEPAWIKGQDRTPFEI